MKKACLLLVLMVFILPAVLAVNLDVEKKSSDEVMILGLSDPAVFSLDVTNNGLGGNFIIYTFFGSGYSPKEGFNLKSGETKNIQLKISPPYTVFKTGFTIFEYFIQGEDKTEYKGELLVKVVDLKEAFIAGAEKIDPESNSLKIYLENRVNFNFENLDVKFISPFFSMEEKFSLAPYGKKSFDVTLNKEDFKELGAGFYTLTAEIKTKDNSANVEGVINFAEKKSIVESVDKYGIFSRTKVITKSNEGNTEEMVGVSVQKNMFSRLITSLSPQPDDVIRKGSKITYVWNKALKPGERLEIKVRTNWFLPFVLALLAVGIVVFVKEYTSTNLKLKKKITFVKSRGEEFALKVSLLVHAKKEVENVLLIERIPPLLKLHTKFGKELPVRVWVKEKKAEWEFKKLEAGERRLITYVVYSRVGVLGRFALPRTSALYEREGKTHKSSSNKVFFLAEQKGEEE